MAGRLYSNDPKLNKAFAEGYAGVPASNPHASGSDAYTAYAAGATQAGTETPCAPYAGVTACSVGAGPGILSVESTVPDDEDTDVLTDATVTVTFSGLLHEDDFANATITITSGDPAVETDYTRSFGETTDIVILTPDDPLAQGTEYTLSIDGVVSGNGDFMVAEYVSTFTTVEEVTVESTVPADEAINVAPDATVTMTFSHLLDENSFDNATLTLTSGEPPVEATYTQAFGGTNDIVVLTPDSDLAYDTEYTLTVSDVVSAVGGVMEAEFTSIFTTVEELTVLSTVPDDEATNVAIDATVTITFSHLLDANSFDDATLTITAGEPPVAVTYTQAFGLTNDIVIVTPDDDLAYETEYTLTVSDVVSAVGGTMSAEFTSTFTTVVETP